MIPFLADWCNVLNTRHWLELLFMRTLLWNWRHSGLYIRNIRNIKAFSRGGPKLLLYFNAL